MGQEYNLCDCLLPSQALSQFSLHKATRGIVTPMLGYSLEISNIFLDRERHCELDLL